MTTANKLLRIDIFGWVRPYQQYQPNWQTERCDDLSRIAVLELHLLVQLKPPIHHQRSIVPFARILVNIQLHIYQNLSNLHARLHLVFELSLHKYTILKVH